MRCLTVLLFFFSSQFSSAQTPNCADTTYIPLMGVSGISVPDALTICTGDTIILEVESGYDSYLRSTGDTTQTISVSDSGGGGVILFLNKFSVIKPVRNYFLVVRNYFWDVRNYF